MSETPSPLYRSSYDDDLADTRELLTQRLLPSANHADIDYFWNVFLQEMISHVEANFSDLSRDFRKEFVIELVNLCVK